MRKSLLSSVLFYDNIIAHFLLKSTDIFEAYPRKRGENYDNIIAHFLLTGSPPRMRGKCIRIPFFQVFSRVTPANAGKIVIINHCSPKVNTFQKNLFFNFYFLQAVPVQAVNLPYRVAHRFIYAFYV